MALKDFLYRCPVCGHDPMAGQGDVATCAACGTRVDRKASCPTCLRVLQPTGVGPVLEVPAATLAERISTLGGALTRAVTKAGTLSYQAGVHVKTAGSERPIRYGHRLLGFAERLGAGAPSLLTLTHDRLRLEPAPASSRPIASRSWALEEIRSLQTSSSAVQITTRVNGVVLFRFDDDSPRRWDELLRHAIAERWKALGKGSVHEFQPRIRTQEAFR